MEEALDLSFDRLLMMMMMMMMMPLHVSSAVVLIIRKSKLYYTASGIITPVGGRLLSTRAPDGHLHSVMIPDAV